MVNYNNSYIYKICCKDTEIKDIYIGSTTNFTRRKCRHKSSCNNENCRDYNFKLYKFIRENGNFQNWDMVLIEEVKCDNKLQLHKIEREYIEKYKSSLNEVIPYITEEERKIHKKKYQETNKEKIKKYKKEYNINNKIKLKEKSKEYREYNKIKLKEKKKKYYENNKERINEHNKKYVENNKELVVERRKIYYEKNKEKLKKINKDYHINNKEEINLKRREWREKNKEEINLKRREKINCDCGSIVNKDALLRHTRSLKHKKYEESKN